ncbi:MAG: 2-oxoisovalerate dehydrogenase [Sphingobacteriales bacterium]|nr:2-oxoisovalerate dehydrogenase [Sphingobacteriales bacterium]
MNAELIFLIQEAPEGGYTAQALGQAVFTEADTYAELKTQIADAVRCHFEPHEMPTLLRLHFVKDEVLVL